MSARRLTLLAFDLDNTLVDRDAAFCAGVKQWVQRDRRFCTKGEEILRQITELDAHGYTPRVEFCEGLAALLDVTHDKANQVWNDIRIALISSIRPDPVVNAMLTILAQETDLALISNGASETQWAKLKAAGLEEYFSKVLISEEVGVTKPSSSIFQLLFSDGRHLRENSLFVGDHPDHDIAGAKNAGMQTCWIRRGRSAPPNLRADLIIDSIHELTPSRES